MKAAIRNRPEVTELGELPAGIDVELIPPRGPVPASAMDAEFLVPAYAAPDLAQTLRRMRQLRVVQSVSAGVEWLLPAAPDGVTLCSARGIRDRAVAEWVLTAVLAMEKELPELVLQQLNAQWKSHMLHELADKRALIVGYGSIGHEVGRALSSVGIDVRGVVRSQRPGVHSVDELDELLPDADIVVLLVPQTSETVGMFDAKRIGLLRTGALLVNAARGPVVETNALVDALRQKRIRAALDVSDPEPLPPDHPLWSAPGVLITPHIAGDTVEAERRLYRFIGEQIRRSAAGRPLLNVVTTDGPRAD